MTAQLGTRKSPYTTRDIVRITIPLLASLVLEMLIGVTDVAFLGRVGEAELGASAVAGVFFITLLMLGLGYSYGMQADMGRRNGEGKLREVGRTFRAGTFFLIALSLLLALFAAVAGPLFFNATIESAEVAECADQYLFWRALGLPFAFLCAAFRAYYVATLAPRVITASSVAMVLSNVLLNYALIFGAGPIPALGIAGAAIASSLSELVALLFFVVHAATHDAAKRHGLFGRFVFERALHAKLFRLGRWLMIQEVAACGSWLFFFICVEHIGESAIALSNILRQICSMVFLIIHAFGSACGAIGANLIGEGRLDEVRGVARRGFVLCTLTVLSLGSLMAAFPEAVLRIFTDLPELTNGSDLNRHTYLVMLSTLIPGVPAMYYQYVMAGLGFTKESSVASFVAVALYASYTAFLAASGVTVTVFWTADITYYLGVGLVTWLYFRRHPWMRLKAA